MVRDASYAELLGCTAAVALLLACTLLVVYVALWVNRAEALMDETPYGWNITRDTWLARAAQHDTLDERYVPARLVVIQHTVSRECRRFATCAAELRSLQSHFMDKLGYVDIPYNFMIGNDARVYEGRGWGVIGAHARKYNNCSLGIGFIGDYRPANMNTKMTVAMEDSALELLEYGVTAGFLHPQYVVMAANDLSNTASPGQNIYDVISTWEHFGITYKNMTCDQICGIGQP